jgi:hypothetical protein
MECMHNLETYKQVPTWLTACNNDSVFSSLQWMPQSLPLLHAGLHRSHLSIGQSSDGPLTTATTLAVLLVADEDDSLVEVLGDSASLHVNGPTVLVGIRRSVCLLHQPLVHLHVFTQVRTGTHDGEVLEHSGTTGYQALTCCTKLPVVAPARVVDITWALSLYLLLLVLVPCRSVSRKRGSTHTRLVLPVRKSSGFAITVPSHLIVFSISFVAASSCGSCSQAGGQRARNRGLPGLGPRSTTPTSKCEHVELSMLADGSMGGMILVQAPPPEAAEATTVGQLCLLMCRWVGEAPTCIECRHSIQLWQTLYTPMNDSPPTA